MDDVLVLPDKPENNVILLNFRPKFNPNQRVSVYHKRKKRTGIVVDCLGTWVITVTPNGVSMQAIPPDEKETVQYAVTFDGNINNKEWFPSNMLTEA